MQMHISSAMYLLVIAVSYGLFGAEALEPVYRLPETAVPLQYNLTLVANPSSTHFSGKVAIDILVHYDTDNITLNSKNLSINQIELQGNQEIGIIPTTFTLDPSKDTLNVLASRQLHAGQHYVLNVDFDGHQTNGIKEVLAGFYRVRTGPGKSDYMSSTVFELILARGAFPCWDEPHIKARFRISVVHPDTYTALSNMPLVHSAPVKKDGWVVDHFANTPLMSSYLVTFHVMNLENIEIQADDGRPLRLWARAEDVAQGRGQLEFSRKVLAWYQNYTLVPEPMPKIDLVAVPKFPGAIENWGDISFGTRELIHKGDGGVSADEVATVAHELAHSWFGNLVTPHWWDSVWLSEGAASFFSALALDEIFPSSHHMAQVTMQYMTRIFMDQAEGIAKPLNPTIRHIEQLGAMPHHVYYQGFSLFNMLYHSLGPKHLRAGIHRYLATYQYGTATPEKLYGALDYQWRGRDLSELMHEWTYQAGLPVVTAIRDGGQLTLSQIPFSLNRSSDVNFTTPDTKWWVPVTYTTQTKKDFEVSQASFWFKEPKTVDDPAPPSDWVMLNIKAPGMFIVKYDKENLEMLLEAISSKNRGGIPAMMMEKLLLDYSLLRYGGYLEKNEGQILRLLKKKAMKDGQGQFLKSSVGKMAYKYFNFNERNDKV